MHTAGLILDYVSFHVIRGYESMETTFVDGNTLGKKKLLNSSDTSIYPFINVIINSV